jgi:hypothetical protein
MKSIAFYAAIVLAALISCTGAEAKRYHHDGKRTITKTVRLKHSTRVRHHRKHVRYAAYAGRQKRHHARQHSVSHYQRWDTPRQIWHGPYYQLVLWDGTLTGPLAPHANGG